MRLAVAVLLLALIGGSARAEEPGRGAYMGLHGSAVIPANRTPARGPGGGFLWTFGFETASGFSPQLMLEWASWETRTRRHGSLAFLGGVAFTPLPSGQVRPFMTLNAGAGSLEDGPQDYDEGSTRSHLTKFPSFLLLGGGGVELWAPGNTIAIGAHVLWGGYLRTREDTAVVGPHLVAGLHVTLGPHALRALGAGLAVLGALR